MRFLYLLFILLPGFLVAQSTYRTETGWQELTISDGLSQGMIYELVQDRQGFIWIATKDGLNRYDGHNFTVFTHDPYNEYSISDNNCSALLVDSRGWVWVGTLNQGLNLFNTRTQRFYHLDIRDQTATNSGNYTIDHLYEDPKGDIWVAADVKKLFKIGLSDMLKAGLPDQPDLAKLTQVSQIPVPEKVIGLISNISFHPNGQALATYETGLQKFNWNHPEKLGKFELTQHGKVNFTNTKGDINQDIWCAAIGNKITLRYQGTLKDILLPKKEYPLIKLKLIQPKTIAIAAADLLWLMSPDELMRQDSLTAQNAFTILPSNLYIITDIIRDQTGNIWLGTNGYGLRKFNPKVKQFHTFLPAKSLSCLYVDRQGRTYVRHEFSYEQLDRPNNQTRPFLPDELPTADKRARYMMQDRQGTFWVSNTNFKTHEMSLFKFSTDWQLLKKYPLPPNTSFGSYNNQTVEDKAGRLWIGAANGKLLQFDPRTETFRVFSYQSLLPQKGAEIETYALCFDQDGTLWIGTQHGLIRANHPQTSPTFSLYKNSQMNRRSLSNDFVLSLLNDPDQPVCYLWVGTKGSGLDRLDKQTGHFDHITEKQGLPNKVVYGILTDEFKNLWLSTNRGLAQFNPKTRTFRNFTKADGLQDDEFNTGSYFKSLSGELMFGGIHGLTTFRTTDVVRKGSSVPQAHLIGLKVNNEIVQVNGPDRILTEGIECTQRIDLAHNQNLLTLEFGLMDFANSAKNQYRYRLNGIDQNWISAGNNRFANYAQLPAGNYTFQMSGSTDGAVWSKPIELQVKVHPPFYRTWWAYLLYAIALAIIAWQLYRFQTQRLLLQQQVLFEQKEASRLADLDGLKTQFFTNISHEFRTPLTLILGPLDDLKQRFPAESVLGLMERNGNRLLSLINQLLDLSKLEGGQLKIELSAGDISAFLRILASSFSSLAESRQIQFTFTQNESERWADFDRDKLEKIVTNLLSNAFKFTPAGNEVRMQVHYPDQGASGTLTITIEDTGIGIAKKNLPHVFERFYQVDSRSNRTYEGTGIGLALVNELVKVLAGTIQVASTEGVGTTFTVTLPLVEKIPTGDTPNPYVGPPLKEAKTSGWEDPFRGGSTYRLGALPMEVSINETVHSPVSDNILLIIDDNVDIRTYVRSIFERDYHVIEAEDGQDGLVKATSALPNLIICDLMMPRLDGFGFCRMLKTQEVTSHIPVVMLTAKATVEDRIEGFELGADDYLTKPFNRIEIMARVRNLIQQRQRLYQRFTTVSPEAPEVTASVESIQPRLAIEQKFLDRLAELVNQHINDPDFSVEDLAEGANLSRSQLHRKLKALIDTSPTNFIRDVRLVKAADLLLEGHDSVTQIAYAVGFDNLSYFAKVFQERYGVLPSQYGKAERSIS